MIENAVFIENIMIIGENEKFASAIISPNFNYLHFWANKHKIHYKNNIELIENETTIARIKKEVDAVNAKLSSHEQVKRFRIVSEEWTAPTGELSPTLKLKRNVLTKKYENLIKEIFGSHDE